MEYQPTFYLVSDLVKRLGKPVTIFDLETTTFRGRPNFAIIEVACFTVTAAGPGIAYSSLIDPEKLIEPKVEELTGITQAMVKGKETWGQRWAQWFETLAVQSWIAGFNSDTFDVPAVIELNARYGHPVAAFPLSFDVRELHLKLSGSKSRKGKLEEVAAAYGVKPSGALHRAMADVILTLETLHRIIDVYGLDAVCEVILPKRADAVDKLSAVAISRYVKGKPRVTSAELAKAFATEERLVGFEVGKAIDERMVDPDVFANDSAQAWFSQALVELDTDLLVSGRLKPIQEALVQEAPDKSWVDYVQLRIALLRAGLSWASLKPV